MIVYRSMGNARNRCMSRLLARACAGIGEIEPGGAVAEKGNLVRAERVEEAQHHVASGVPFGAFRCSPPGIAPPARPAMKNGTSS